MSSQLIEALTVDIGAPPVSQHGVQVWDVPPETLQRAARTLRDKHGFSLLLDITAVDCMADSGEFELRCHFHNPSERITAGLRSRVKGDQPVAPTLTGLYPAAGFLEREVHEMFGISFAGNPDMRPVLLFPGFDGYPLRKDFAIDRVVTPWDGVMVQNAADNAAGDDNSMVVNFGPSHPAMHGTIQIVMKLSGENVESADVHCGFLHRGFEKECERHNYHNIIAFTDRLNYCSAMMNNFVYAEAVEKLAGIPLTDRCRYVRTLLAEYSRLTDHLTCIAASVMEVGGMTPFLYLMTIRDYMYEHQAHLTGSRLTHSFVRFGGLAADVTDAWLVRLEELLKFYEEYVVRVHKLLDRNRIFIDRMRGTGKISTADALAWGFTGPMLRSTGLAYDLRKAQPYLAYSDMDFEIPVGIAGDNYDRYYVRMREMDESVSIIRQCIKKMPQGSVNDPKVTFMLPKIPSVPAGEIFAAHEVANGWLGVFLVSRGGRTPYRLHVRGPSFVHIGGLRKLLEGGQLADVVATFGTINMIGGECDR